MQTAESKWGPGSIFWLSERNHRNRLQHRLNKLTSTLEGKTRGILRTKRQDEYDIRVIDFDRLNEVVSFAFDPRRTAVESFLNTQKRHGDIRKKLQNAADDLQVMIQCFIDGSPVDQEIRLDATHFNFGEAGPLNRINIQSVRASAVEVLEASIQLPDFVEIFHELSDGRKRESGPYVRLAALYNDIGIHPMIPESFTQTRNQSINA